MTCSVYFRLFPVQTCRCSVQNQLLCANKKLLRTNMKLLRTNTKILRTNMNLLRTNMKILRANMKLLRTNMKLLRTNLKHLCRNLKLLHRIFKLLRAKYSTITNLPLPSPRLANNAANSGGGEGQNLFVENEFTSKLLLENMKSCCHCEQHFQDNVNFYPNCGKKLLNSKCLTIFIK